LTFAGRDTRTDAPAIQVIVALRRLPFTGPEIAEVLDRHSATSEGDPAS
jgi:hypothetical protein